MADVTLLRRMSAGDEEAFTALYRRRQGGIYRFALQMSGSEAIAEDVTQEVFLLLIREETAYDPSRGSLQGFLYGVARNHVLRALERNREASDGRRSRTVRSGGRGYAGESYPRRSAWRRCGRRCWRCPPTIARWWRCAIWRRWITRARQRRSAARWERFGPGCIVREGLLTAKLRADSARCV